MCGICGVFNFASDRPVDSELIKDMVVMQKHRGPDEFSVFMDNNIGLGHARLSIIDLHTGSQPICNEDESIWVVFNGEIFNYIELRDSLKKRGHRFRTESDTEVLVHLYEEYHTEFLDQLNGQFAFAIWDSKKKELMLARDRVGIRPLFYCVRDGQLTFASELKSLLVNPNVPREVDPIGLKQIFSLWTTVGERTPLKNVWEVPPGFWFVIKNGNLVKKKYWDVDFSVDGQEKLTKENAAEQLKALLIDSTRLRLRADVPVGAYLSGGLDSSVITSIIDGFTDTPLKTFSVSFADERYDESLYQKDMAGFLGVEHNEISCTYEDIGNAFPDVVWHTERPILRTAPTPLFLLSNLVREHSFKVVLTGEGSDEILGGYGIFKEDKLRRFWARAPESAIRPLLLKKLYPYLPLSTDRAFVFLKKFFEKGLLETGTPYYSHMLRFDNASWLARFFSQDIHESVSAYDPVQDLVDSLPADYYHWTSLAKAQYLEMQTLLSRYLLSSQGDRMAMAHSIEGRFPFLDHRVIEFCAKLPPEYKLNVFNEKYILKKAMHGLVPDSILNRSKQAYRAPDVKSFFPKEATCQYVDEFLSADKLQKYGIFAVDRVQTLLSKCKRMVHGNLGEKDNMAFVSLLSTQIFCDRFVANFPKKINRDGINFRVVDLAHYM